MKALQQFFESRPSLSKEGVCREAGLSSSALDYYLRGRTKSLRKATREKLYPVLNKYGGKFDV